MGGLRILAELEDPADRRAPEAGRQIARYLREGLPLHARDEDDSIAPRLAAVDPSVRPLLDTLAEGHARLDAVMPDILADLDRVADGAPVDRDAFARHHADFAAIMVPHLELEEREFFPAVAALGEDDRAAIVAEMVARRR